MSPSTTRDGAKSFDKVANFYGDGEAYEAILRAADEGCETDADTHFVEQMIQRWDEYGMRAFLSEPQNQWLRRLAGERP